MRDPVHMVSGIRLWFLYSEFFIDLEKLRKTFEIFSPMTSAVHLNCDLMIKTMVFAGIHEWAINNQNEL